MPSATIPHQHAGRYLARTVAVLSFVVACHTMRPVPAAHVNPVDLPPRVWVTSADRSTVILDAPRLTGDTLAGWVGREYREIPLAQTTAIRTRERAPARTAVVVTAATVATLGAFFYLESRRDVGDAQVCLNASDHIPDHFTPCCVGQDSVPC